MKGDREESRSRLGTAESGAMNREAAVEQTAEQEVRIRAKSGSR